MATKDDAGIPAGATSTGAADAFPTRYLPRPQVRDMPEEPRRYWRLIGPGIIAAGVGLASGEFVLFPYIASQVGLVFVWAAIVGLITQYFLNMEIERYTLATGETALTGFSRYWRHWGLVFAVLTYFANLWPGWTLSSATLTTYLFGGEPRWVGIGMLVAIGLILTLAPVVYVALEKTQMVKVAAVLTLFVVAAFVAIGASAWSDSAQVVTRPRIPLEELGFALLLGALAFAGAGGGQNLVQSNWMRDKGFGMGAYVPRLVSPVTGQPEAAPSTGYVFEPTPENLRRWQGWWRFANIEQLITFVLITFVTILFTSLLAYATVFGRDDLQNNIGFLEIEGQVLGERVGSWFQYLFWAIGAFSLFAAALGIVDYTSRLAADVIKTSYRREASESKIYAGLVWGLVIIGIGVLLLDFSQPLVLLVISAVVGGFMMFLYSGLLILINRRILPAPIRIRGVRLGALIWAIGLFGVLSVLTFRDQITKLFG
ncbi:Nramp family divalent metal transporter [Jidongwangia harbinensis]|uniref:Nramp family divalent metal transporter n=1 Tax=Jidongwangia harbinensis TaxID=2878561 RepID=UPI001CD95EB2|nr:Nramp family divalent metal transporter [Jidongwangia harbinensis]MCA2217398.1 Nramp family divalent metal transporter [Jidongwangia harbinensis]